MCIMNGAIKITAHSPAMLFIIAVTVCDFACRFSILHVACTHVYHSLLGKGGGIWYQQRQHVCLLGRKSFACVHVHVVKNDFL